MSAIADPEAPLDNRDEERELCPHCLTPNPSGKHFCSDCGAPLSSYAATAPFEAILAEGHVYRSAVERPQKPIVWLGVLVIFGSFGLAGLTLVFIGSPLYAAIGALVVVVAVWVILRATANHIRQPRPAKESEPPTSA
jgi:hypothetical protein